MSKKTNTDPNFPPPPANDVDDLLDGLRKPIALDVKKTSAESSGLDAAEYQGSARLPPAREDHATVPNDRVIVEKTPVPPLAEGLEVTPEERERLNALFAAATAPPSEPRKSDPPAVQTEPPVIPTRKTNLVSIFTMIGAAVVIGAIIVWLLAPHEAPTKTDAAPSATPTTSASVAPAPTTPPTTSALPTPTASHPTPTPRPSATPRTQPRDAAAPDDDDPGARLLKGH